MPCIVYSDLQGPVKTVYPGRGNDLPLLSHKTMQRLMDAG